MCGSVVSADEQGAIMHTAATTESHTADTITGNQIHTADIDVAAWHRRLCRVTDGLWLSGDLDESPERAVSQLNDWRSAGVTHVLDCRIEYSDERLVRQHAPEISYLHLGVDDDGGEQQQAWFDAGVAWVQAALADPHNNVLVHCHMGVNRAPSMVFAVLLAAGWDVREALDRIVAARPIAAVLYASDALDWHHARSDTRDDELLRKERELVEQWVDDRLDDAVSIVGRLRTALADTSAWRRIDRDELVEEICASTSLGSTEALDILDTLEDCIVEVLDESDAVEFPGLGPLDALDHDQTPDPEPSKTVSLLDLVPAIARRCRIQASIVVTAIERLTSVIEEACAAGDVVYLPVLGDFGPDDAMSVIDAEDRAESMERLRASKRQTWLIQCNPTKFDLFDAVDHEGLPTNWSVSRYLDRIQPGDRVVFWVSGPQSGVYAIGEITSERPYEDTVNDEYAVDPNPSWTNYVDFDLHLDLFDRPVLRADLKADPRFAGQSIIRIPAAANPHQLDQDAFDAILERIT